MNNIQSSRRPSPPPTAASRTSTSPRRPAPWPATNILLQAGVSVLAQANQAPQLALKLLG